MSNDLWQVLNQPIEVELSGNKYKARLLPLRSVYAWAETQVVNEVLSNIQRVAAALPPEDKVNYLTKATAEAIPTGSVLEEKAAGKLRSMDAIRELLYQALKPDQPSITREEATTLVEENAKLIGTLVPKLIRGLGETSSPKEE